MLFKIRQEVCPMNRRLAEYDFYYNFEDQFIIFSVIDKAMATMNCGNMDTNQGFIRKGMLLRGSGQLHIADGCIVNVQGTHNVVFRGRPRTRFIEAEDLTVLTQTSFVEPMSKESQPRFFNASSVRLPDYNTTALTVIQDKVDRLKTKSSSLSQQIQHEQQQHQKTTAF